MNELMRAADSYAMRKISEFLRTFKASVLAEMFLDFEDAVFEPTYDPRYRAILDAGFSKVGGDAFNKMVQELRDKRYETEKEPSNVTES